MPVTGLCPTDRYVVHRNGVAVFSTNDLHDILLFLWGKQLRFKYVVYDNPDIVAWIKPLLEAR